MRYPRHLQAQVLREVWRITERRSGTVYRTEFVERRWVNIPPFPVLGTSVDGDPDLVWVPVSTTYVGDQFRTIEVPDDDITVTPAYEESS